MSSPKIEIKISQTENFFDLSLCAKEFLEFIDDFKLKFKKKRFFILTAYYDSVLAGLLISEDKSKKIDSIFKIIPIFYLHLVYVNPLYRNKNIGRELLKTFIMFQKKHGVASIYVKLPQKYKKE